MKEINKEELLNEIKVKLNILKKQSSEISMINFNFNIGFLETLIKQEKIQKEITTLLIKNLTKLNINKIDIILIEETIEIINKINI